MWDTTTSTHLQGNYVAAFVFPGPKRLKSVMLYWVHDLFSPNTRHGQKTTCDPFFLTQKTS